MDDLISRQAAITAMTNYFARWAEYTAWSKTIKAMVETAQEAAREMLTELPSEQPEIIRCKDCKHKPHPSDSYDHNKRDCGFEIIFPDYRCPCRCEDEFYNHIPDDDWFCGNAERREDE